MSGCPNTLNNLLNFYNVRRYLLFLLIALASIGKAEAQYRPNIMTPFGKYKYGGNPYYTKLDTVSNTAADTLYCTLPAWYNSLTFSYLVTKLTGTPSSCTITLQASNEPWSTAIDYTTLYTDNISTNTTQYYTHVIAGNPWTRYRVIFTGVGTQSCSWLSNVLER
jgi:hypothetical protein